MNTYCVKDPDPQKFENPIRIKAKTLNPKPCYLKLTYRPNLHSSSLTYPIFPPISIRSYKLICNYIYVYVYVYVYLKIQQRSLYIHTIHTPSFMSPAIYAEPCYRHDDGQTDGRTLNIYGPGRGRL